MMRANRIGRPAASAAFLGLLLAVAGQGPASAEPHGIDTEHLFGFTEGSDIGVPGERELESETTSRVGKRGGRFRAFDSGLALKMPLTDWFRVAPGISFAAYDIGGVPGLADRSVGTFSGAFVEARFRLLRRDAAPFGLTLNVVPSLGRIDAGTGQRVRSYGSEFGLLVDRELIPGLVVGAINLGYGLASVRSDAGGATAEGSNLEVAGALAYQIQPGLFLGGEARYVRAYGGLALEDFAGDAVYLGPTLYTALSERAWLSFTWGRQVHGRAVGERGDLDLTTFDRHQLRLRIGYSF
ncbi:hypothetical protein [Methylobacterium iners]|uniref:Uncharacterized protein n=1 Tax=Methylobacterium iners TaxID=418707 RepID=A0ABQ4RWF7_9HYPH|nr:hypothetical protein [Methylobacterium iners]GJD94579.1 hypothetical protein OCOJLMKI_1782 [Methylobacterium iners]